MHLLAAGAWSAVFGAFVWMGPRAPGWDVRLPGEENWPVFPWAEWVYAAGYASPLIIAWIAPTRTALRAYGRRLAVLTAVSSMCFLILPVVSPPRVMDADADGFSARLLALELGRADFAAASLPSFHVFWAMLIGQIVAERGRMWRFAGLSWAVVMSFACVLNGAHAVADVAASWIIWSAMETAFRRRGGDGKKPRR